MRSLSVIVLDMQELLRRVEEAEKERSEQEREINRLNAENDCLEDKVATRDWKIEELEREMRKLRGVKASACL
jgi:predicted RNase H-like nuclease (RuvC/YqgF family)